MTQIAEQLRWALQPMAHILADPQYTDIHINGAGEDGTCPIFTKSRGRREKHVVNLDHAALMAIARHAAVLNRNRINEVTPIAPGIFPNGQRAQIVVPSAVDGKRVAMSIRRAADVPMTPEELERRGVFTMTRHSTDARERAGVAECWELYQAHDYRTMIERAFFHGLNVCFMGQMNTGKTTNLLAFSFAIPRDRRIATIADTNELSKMPHEDIVHFQYPKDKTGVAQHTSEMCSEACLRMDFDEIINGEVRDAAAWALARVGISGHSIKTSLHASSAEDTPNALAAMAKQHDTGKTIPIDDLRQTFRQLIDIAVFSEVVDGEKRITQIWFDPASKNGIPSNVRKKLEDE